MIVAPGAYLTVIADVCNAPFVVTPDTCKNSCAPLRRHSGRAQRDPESVTAVEFSHSTDAGFRSPFV